MRIGFVTDEISLDIEEAIKTGVSWGITDYELRIINGDRIPFISGDAVNKILDLKHEFNLNFSALSPGTFKSSIHNEELLEYELNEVIPKTFELAHLLNANKVISFSFQRVNVSTFDEMKSVIDIFQQVSEQAKNHDLILAIENEPGFWCDCGKNTATLIEKVNASSLRVNWDPANAIGTEEIPFPNGYKAVKQYIANVHVKDTVLGALVECVPIGEGKVDWQGQLGAMVREQVVDLVTIETHCTPLVEKSKQNLRVVKQILDSFESENML